MGTKTALVTGASGGIGRAFSVRLAKEGYAVCSVARSESKLKELNQSLGSGTHKHLVADLSTLEGIRTVSEEIGKNHYDVVVNNAGVGMYGRFDQADLKQLRSMMHLNCDALVELSHAFLKTAKTGDTLINVSSTLSLMSMPAAGLYSATKAFVTSFTESLWYEQKTRGVHVIALCPGVTTTGFHEAAGGKNNATPPKSISQTPEEVVDTAIHALEKGLGPIVISGGKNKAMATVFKFFPRRAVIKLMGKMGDKRIQAP